MATQRRIRLLLKLQKIELFERQTLPFPAAKGSGHAKNLNSVGTECIDPEKDMLRFLSFPQHQ